MRTEVTYRERWPYSTNSLLPRVIGEAFWLPGVIGWSCACAWLDANSPNVTPPANAAPPLRSSLRLVRFKPISPSFERGFLSMTRRRNHVPADESIRGLAKSGQCSCASTPGEIDAAFATLRQRRAGALLVGSGTFFPSRRQQIVTLAARDAIPAMYMSKRVG